MAALGITLARVPFASITSKGPVGVAIPLTVGIASVVGNNAVSVVIVSDFTRYSKTVRIAEPTRIAMMLWPKLRPLARTYAPSQVPALPHSR